MARVARVVAADFPHHIVQRGNRRQQVFFGERDYLEYLSLLQEHANKSSVDISLYCLIPNHVHLIAVPRNTNSLAKAIGEAHRKYTRMINYRNNWRGYLWQGRFSSYLLDETYLLAAARYILLNPVRAGLVEKAQDYRWSSISHHLNKVKDPLVKDDIFKDLIYNWGDFLSEEPNTKDVDLLKLHERTGRPLGTEGFVEQLETALERRLKKNKPGPKKRKINN